MTILLVYASKHGHTAKIVARIAETLEHDGVAVTQAQLGDAAEPPSPHGFDAVILGASIHAGHHQDAAVRWAERHRAALATVPSAFFSVCLTAADDTEESRTATRGYLDDFVDRSGWTPTRMTTFAGALQYREYDFATRLLMRLLMRRGGHPTDASRDYDYTDWDAVERFARECAALAVPAGQSSSDAR